MESKEIERLKQKLDRYQKISYRNLNEFRVKPISLPEIVSVTFNPEVYYEGDERVYALGEWRFDLETLNYLVPESSFSPWPDSGLVREAKRRATSTTLEIYESNAFLLGHSKLFEDRWVAPVQYYKIPNRIYKRIKRERFRKSPNQK